MGHRTKSDDQGSVSCTKLDGNTAIDPNEPLRHPDTAARKQNTAHQPFLRRGIQTDTILIGIKETVDDDGRSVSTVHDRVRHDHREVPMTPVLHVTHQ